MAKTEFEKEHGMQLMFLGGVENEVTASSTLISVIIDGEKRYGLVDIGGYQGSANVNEYFPVNASMLDFVVVTHAHYDHIGLLPKIYREGFRGKVYITEQAKNQGHLILQDAANINLKNSEYNKCGGKELESKKNKFEKDKRKSLRPRDVKNFDSSISSLDEVIDSVLYSHEDVKGVLHLYEVIKPNTEFAIFDGKLRGKLIPTTHQNGAIQLELYYTQSDSEEFGVLFTGDVGPYNSLFYCADDDTINPNINYGIIESLHGIEPPAETLEESIFNLEKLIKKSIRKGKTVILSGFSLDRDAMLVYLINKMFEKGAHFKAYFDAPLAHSELMCYQNSYNKEYERRKSGVSKDEENDLWFKDLGKNPFGLERFEVITKTPEHIGLLNTTSPKVVVTSSANGNGGRIVDFFDKFIQDSNTVFVFCGWIYPESPSRLLLNTEQGQIVDFGYSRYKKNCETVQLHGFSSHGYFEDILDKLYAYPKMSKLILNHGDLVSKESMAKALEELFDVDVHIPMLYDAYELSSNTLRKMEEFEIHEAFGNVVSDFNMRNVLEEFENAKIEKAINE